MADKGGEKVTAPTAATVDEALSKLSGASSDSSIPFSVELLKALAKGSQEAVQYAKQVNREYATTFPEFKDAVDNDLRKRLFQMVFRVLEHVLGDTDYSTIEELAQDPESLLSNMPAIADVLDNFGELIDMDLDEALGIGTNATVNVSADALKGAFTGSKQRVPRPQDKFKDEIDNISPEFKSKFVDESGKPHPKAFDRAVKVHPFESRIMALELPGYLATRAEEQPFSSYDEVPLDIISTVEELNEAIEELCSPEVHEVAVDLENHNYRSYQGFLCLMQLSTRSKDYIIDCLKLRDHMNLLAPLFMDASVLKVLHGCDHDVLWLQRDFGLSLINVFDTFEASKILNFPRHSLAFLSKRFANYEPNKTLQRADWRIRPLPQDMIDYARGDTHYLLGIFDRIRNALLDAPPGPEGTGNPMLLSYKRSNLKCARLYSKPKLEKDGYKVLLQRASMALSPPQERVCEALYTWRDLTARELDESTMFVLPSLTLLKIAQAMPETTNDLVRACNPLPSVVRQSADKVVKIVQAAVEGEELAFTAEDMGERGEEGDEEMEGERAAGGGGGGGGGGSSVERTLGGDIALEGADLALDGDEDEDEDEDMDKDDSNLNRAKPAAGLQLLPPSRPERDASTFSLFSGKAPSSPAPSLDLSRRSEDSGSMRSTSDVDFFEEGKSSEVSLSTNQPMPPYHTAGDARSQQKHLLRAVAWQHLDFQAIENEQSLRASNIIGDVEETHSELLKDSEASISGILLKKHELMSPFTKNDRDETMDSLKTPQKMHRSTDGSHLLQSDVKTGSRRASPSGDFTNSEVSVLFRRGDSTVSALREILQEHEGMESYSDVVAGTRDGKSKKQATSHRLAFIVLQSLEGRPVSVFTPQPLGQPESEESRGASANNFEETKAESGADASESEGEGSGSLLVDTRYGRIMLGAGEKAKRHALAMRQRGQDSASASVDPSAAVGEVEGITSVLDAGGLTSYANVPPSLSAIYRVSNNNRNKPKDRKKVVDANLDIDAIANDERLTESARATLRIAATGDDDSGRRGSVTSTTSVNDKVPSAASSSVQFLRKIGWIGESEQPDLLPVRRDDIGSDGGSGNEGSVKSKDSRSKPTRRGSRGGKRNTSKGSGPSPSGSRKSGGRGGYDSGGSDSSRRGFGRDVRPTGRDEAGGHGGGLVSPFLQSQSIRSSIGARVGGPMQGSGRDRGRGGANNRGGGVSSNPYAAFSMGSRGKQADKAAQWR